jgi:hypothetical protein
MERANSRAQRRAYSCSRLKIEVQTVELPSGWSGRATLTDFTVGRDKLDFRALGVDAADVLIVNGKGAARGDIAK